MNQRQYDLAKRHILEGDRDDLPRETTNSQSIEECRHLEKRIVSLEAIRDAQRRTIALLEADLAQLRERLKGQSNG